MKYTTCLLKRYGKVLFVCLAAAVGTAVMLGSSCSVFNKAPTVPVISGPSAGVVGVPVTFKATATDPEGDSIAFQFDWGDSSTLAWTNLVASGETTSVLHTYSDSGTFSVKARAKDKKGKEAIWSLADELGVTDAGPGYPDTVVARVSTYSGSYHVAVSLDGSRFYVTHRGYALLSVVDVVSLTEVKMISVAGEANDAAITPAGDYVVVSGFGSDNTVSIVRTADDTAVAVATVEGTPQRLAVDPSGRQAYLATGTKVAVIGIPDGAIMGYVEVGGACTDVVVDSAGGFLYVADADNSRILVIALPGLNQVASVALDVRPYVLALGRDSMLYAASALEPSVVAVNTRSKTVVNEATLEFQPNDIATDPSGDYIYITDYRGIRFIRASSLTVVGSLEPGTSALEGIGISPTGDRLYIGNHTYVLVLGRSSR